MTVVFENLCNSPYIRSMRRWVRFFIIFFAYGMALLHTAVPHHHEDASERRVTVTHAGCVFSHSNGGFLQMVFSTDLGYGHLEIFKKNTENQIQFSAAAASVIAVFSRLVFAPAPVSERARFNGFVEKLQKRRRLYSATQFRAPPRVA
jgi:hypothetical protein